MVDVSETREDPMEDFNISQTFLSDVELFRLKSIKSRQKLERFFGEPLPIDVSISELDAYGLKAMLQSSVPLCYFLYQLLEELCSENLFFYIEVEQFENMTFQSERCMKEIAMELYHTFIENNSEFEVNIDTKTRKPILEQIQTGNQRCFVDAKEHIVKLMEPVYQKFQNSPVWVQMKRELGNTNIYNREARNCGVRIILKNLDKTLPDPKRGRLGQRRHDMIRSMLHAFCETRLGIDFIDRDRNLGIPSRIQE